MTEELDAVLAQALGLLAEGAAGPGSAWRTVTLGSVGQDGAPRLRSVVLRGFGRAEPWLEVHTDARSAKVAELSARPLACLHGWDAGRAVQLRASGPVSLHRGDAVAAAAWAMLREQSRATYRVMPGPGARLDGPDEAVPVLDDAAAQAVFVVLRLSIASLEWLHLAEHGHRRAVFTWANSAARGMWLAP